MAIVNAILPDRGSIAMQGKATGAPRNRLADETSPYLAQHAANPVDWYPWGEAAIGRARELDRPILLSIGYSACHWCHVMAHESFEDEATAAVDEPALRQREGGSRGAARPRQGLPARAPGADAARRRLAAHDVPRAGRPHAVLWRHLFSGHAALRHAGVRGPHRARRRLLPRGARGCRLAERRPARRIRGPRAAGGRCGSGDHSRAARPGACKNLAASFDPRFGGFGPAPKFPHAASIELLLREWRASAAQPSPTSRRGTWRC